GPIVSGPPAKRQRPDPGQRVQRKTETRRNSIHTVAMGGGEVRAASLAVRHLQHGKATPQNGGPLLRRTHGTDQHEEMFAGVGRLGITEQDKKRRTHCMEHYDALVSRGQDRGLTTSGSNVSFWLDSVEPIRFTPLTSNLDTEVVIVGGGIAGLSVAYNLVRAGRQVVVRGDGLIGS